MDERRAEARDSIRYHVWCGQYQADEIFDIIEDEVFDGDEDEEAWLRSAIKREFRKKQAAERDWPEVTSCDHLDRVFDLLHERGVLTRHRCGMTIQDGLEVVEQLYQEAGGSKSGFLGYCFYHLQDMEAALWGEHGLLLAFGSFNADPANGINVGQIIRDEFERNGLDVIWDGTIDSRLLLKGFRWQRRSPESA